MEIGKIDIKNQFTENEFKGSVYRKIRIEKNLNGKSKPLLYSIENHETQAFLKMEFVETVKTKSIEIGN